MCKIRGSANDIIDLIILAEKQSVDGCADRGTKGCPGNEKENPIENVEDEDEPCVPFMFHEFEHRGKEGPCDGCGCKCPLFKSVVNSRGDGKMYGKDGEPGCCAGDVDSIVRVQTQIRSIANLLEWKNTAKDEY